jgi:hypothetical protein
VVLELGLALAGPGGGPAGVTAARALGLTTQVPAVEMYAVAGRPRSAPAGVRFVSRSVERRIHRLAPIEVALLEVLRDWPGTSESTWEDLVAIVRTMSEADLRIDVLKHHVESEVHVRLRER